MSDENIYNWPKQFLEASELEEVVKNQNVYVDDYVNMVHKDYLEAFNEEELQLVLKKISKLASFFSRLKTNTEDALGEIIITRMMDEADLEAEGDYDNETPTQLKRVDSDVETMLNQMLQEEE